MGIAHSRCRIGRMECALGCALTGNLNPVFLLWESGLESHVFLHLFFLLSMYFRIFLEKRIEQLLPQSLEPTLSVLLPPLPSPTFQSINSTVVAADPIHESNSRERREGEPCQLHQTRTVRVLQW